METERLIKIERTPKEKLKHWWEWNRPWWMRRSMGVLSRQVIYVKVTPGLRFTMTRRWEAHLLIRLLRRAEIEHMEV